MSDPTVRAPSQGPQTGIPAGIARKRVHQSVFKEEIKYHGVTIPTVDRIARDRFTQLRDREKDEIFSLCEALLQTDYIEEAFIAFNWTYRLRERHESRDFEVFEGWLSRYVNNWAKCDSLCNHTIAAFLEKYPGHVQRLKLWAKSENRWLRRASAVTLVLPARRGAFLKDVFESLMPCFLTRMTSSEKATVGCSKRRAVSTGKRFSISSSARGLSCPGPLYATRSKRCPRICGIGP